MHRVRVAAVNDYEIVVEGLGAVLSRYPDRLDVRELIIMGEPVDEPVDVALYDTYGRAGVASPAHRIRRHGFGTSRTRSTNAYSTAPP